MSLEPAARTFNPHWSFALLALAFSFYLFGQTRLVEGQKETLKYQLKNAKTQDDNLVKAGKQLQDAIASHEADVKKASDLQIAFQTVLRDLLDLAKTDSDAKDMVEKYGIRAPEDQPAAPAGH